MKNCGTVNANCERGHEEVTRRFLIGWSAFTDYGAITLPLVRRYCTAGTDTGLEGKYYPKNGIAQLIQDKSAESAASKIFENEHVLVFMPLPDEEVVVLGVRSQKSEVRGQRTE